MANLILIFAIGTLSAGPGLPRAAEVKVERGYYPNLLDNADKYPCYVGVQNRHTYLMGRVVYFYDAERNELLNIPMLVVDAAAPHHAGVMEKRYLLMDIYCKDGLHLGKRYGFLVSFDNDILQNKKDGTFITAPVGDISDARYRNVLADILWKYDNICGYSVPRTDRAIEAILQLEN